MDSISDCGRKCSRKEARNAGQPLWEAGSAISVWARSPCLRLLREEMALPRAAARRRSEIISEYSLHYGWWGGIGVRCLFSVENFELELVIDKVSSVSRRRNVWGSEVSRPRK